MRELRSAPGGLTSREAARRLQTVGPNELERRHERHWPRELADQLTHPLALLLWLGALLALLAGIKVIAIAIVVVIVINAAFAFVQEQQAEQAVEALLGYLPQYARVVRDGAVATVPARELVPGDVLEIAEGDRISADARLIGGSLEVDMSPLTGESMPVERDTGSPATGGSAIAASDLVFNGTVCIQGEARAVVFATGMHTEIGRIAALSQRVRRAASPLEAQVRRVAWIIAAIALGLGVLFVPFAMLASGLSLQNAAIFAIGLIVGNVPEGLLPVITLALALGMRELARDGAVVKRLSAVETLGSVDVICTDKTGTLTINQMKPVYAWVAGEEYPLADVADVPGAAEPALSDTAEPARSGTAEPALSDTAEPALSDTAEPALSDTEVSARPAAASLNVVAGPVARLATALALCNNVAPAADDSLTGDATEVALLEAARVLSTTPSAAERDSGRVAEYRFDPELKLMSTADRVDGAVVLHVKGAPEAVLDRCAAVLGEAGERRLTGGELADVHAAIERFAVKGLRVLAVADRRIDEPLVSGPRAIAERDLTLLGLVAVVDPPRPEVAAAVASCHAAGIRVVMITGDHPVTAEAIAREVGIVRGAAPRVITEDELDALPEIQLDELLRDTPELIFARSTPEAKLRIADALRDTGHVVAMTGDGVNDAPALQRADIGIAMGRSGTDVAREAATIVLTDDNFATIVVAIEAGRRIYANIRKFVFYIFSHSTPEVTPFMVFALAGGSVPLPLTVLQLLVFDIGTETLPALALGREPAEPGIMRGGPRARDAGIVDRAMLLRAWLFTGTIAAGLSMAAYFYVLKDAGWSPGDAVGEGAPLHHAYLQATTMTLVSMIFCQIGTALAARTERASLRSTGLLSNPMLIWGIAFELLLTAAIVYVPPLQKLLHTAALPGGYLLILLPMPLIVWGADELRRAWLRRRATRPESMS